MCSDGDDGWIVMEKSVVMMVIVVYSVCGAPSLLSSQSLLLHIPSKPTATHSEKVETVIRFIVYLSLLVSLRW